ncbi:MAG: hypothetical protein VZR27_06020 [Acutalibacteraceae bacterium]|nr:hypothetical protein [Acutalibacteraceae bacterium]
MDEKKKAYTRPWFWLLIILIVSVIIKAVDNAEKVEQLLSPQDNYGEEEYITASKKAVTEEPEQPEQITETAAQTFHFIMNKSTKKYHTEHCTAAAKITESKREETDIEASSVEAAKQILEQQGYSPCTRCNSVGN